MQEDLTKWLPLIAVVITGFFALKQIRTNNITNARIKWLEVVKTLITDFFAESSILTIKKGVEKHINKMRSIGHNPNDAEAFAKEVGNDTLDHLKIIEIKYDLIKLNLNPKEDLHTNFEKILDIYMSKINQIPIKEGEEYRQLSQEMSKCYDKLLLLARYIMKLEWEKTKRQTLSFAWYMRFGKGKSIRKEALAITH